MRILDYDLRVNAANGRGLRSSCISTTPETKGARNSYSQLQRRAFNPRSCVAHFHRQAASDFAAHLAPPQLSFAFFPLRGVTSFGGVSNSAQPSEKIDHLRSLRKSRTYSCYLNIVKCSRSWPRDWFLILAVVFHF